MTVYVDDAVHPWRGQRWAHLMADTLAELHAMAAQLGIPPRAFQNKASGAHYDVTSELRAQAIALGTDARSMLRTMDADWARLAYRAPAPTSADETKESAR